MCEEEGVLCVNYAHPDSMRPPVFENDITPANMKSFQSPNGMVPYVTEKPQISLRLDRWEPEMLRQKPRAVYHDELHGSSMIPNISEISQYAALDIARQRTSEYPTTGVYGWKNHSLPGGKDGMVGVATGLHLVQEPSSKHIGHTRIVRTTNPQVTNHVYPHPKATRTQGVTPADQRTARQLRLPRRRHAILDPGVTPLPNSRLHQANGVGARPSIVMGMHPRRRMARNAAYAGYRARGETYAAAFVVDDDTSMFREPPAHLGVAMTKTRQHGPPRVGFFKHRRRDRASCIQTSLSGPAAADTGNVAADVLMRDGKRTLDAATMRAPGLRVFAPRNPVYHRPDLSVSRVTRTELPLYQRVTPQMVREIDPVLASATLFDPLRTLAIGDGKGGWVPQFGSEAVVRQYADAHIADDRVIAE